MQYNKLGSGKRFLKVKAKVSGFLIARIEKRVTPEKRVVVTIKSKKNTILTSGLQNLLNAFQTYMSGVSYVGENASSSGIIITTSSGQTFTLSFVTTPGVSATSNSAIISFTVRDDSANSYTATSEELITQSAGYNIPIATANLSVTKQSDEILTLTWIITITISTSAEINYIPTPTPQSGGVGGCAFTGESCVCSVCKYYSTGGTGGCSLTGLSNQYPQSNFITSSLFTDMFYNTYSEASPNPYTQVVGMTLYIYTPYSTTSGVTNFIVGAGDFVVYCPSNQRTCYTSNETTTPVYLQLYTSSETAPYIGVQIEFTT